MADESTKPNGAVPPKVTLKQNGGPATPPPDQTPTDQTPTVPDAASAPALKKITTRIDFSATAIPTPTEEKKKTARVMPPLDMPSPEGAEPGTSATEIAPSTTKTVKLKRPGELGFPGFPTDVGATAAKSKTSRIILEAALAPEAGGDEAGAVGIPLRAPPKTIRIRRPGEPAATEPPPPPPVEEPSAKRKTSRLDVPVEKEAGPPTQRKTIRIKRPEAGGGAARTVTIARTEERPTTATAPEAAPEAAAAPEVDEPGVVFSIVAIAALLVAGVLIYVLAAQAFPSMNLPWPGRIVM